MTSEKLIKEYQAKIEAEKQSIIRYTEEIRDARKFNNDSRVEIAAEDRRAASIREQAYTQFVKDLEDLQSVYARA